VIDDDDDDERLRRAMAAVARAERDWQRSGPDGWRTVEDRHRRIATAVIATVTAVPYHARMADELVRIASENSYDAGESTGSYPSYVVDVDILMDVVQELRKTDTRSER
jgi:hypothetical protein